MLASMYSSTKSFLLPFQNPVNVADVRVNPREKPLSHTQQHEVEKRPPALRSERSFRYRVCVRGRKQRAYAWTNKKCCSQENSSWTSAPHYNNGRLWFPMPTASSLHVLTLSHREKLKLKVKNVWKNSDKCQKNYKHCIKKIKMLLLKHCWKKTWEISPTYIKNV